MNENSASDKDLITKVSIESTLLGFCENLFRNNDDKAHYTYGISVVLNRIAEEIRANKEVDRHAQYVEGISEEESVDPEWEKTHEKFIK